MEGLADPEAADSAHTTWFHTSSVRLPSIPPNDEEKAKFHPSHPECKVLKIHAQMIAARVLAAGKAGPGWRAVMILSEK
jgi:hypothetical protein